MITQQRVSTIFDLLPIFREKKITIPLKISKFESDRQTDNTSS